jgi:hypothetical protein
VATVYTERFLVVQGASGTNDPAVGPPEGFRWVLRDIEVFCGNQIGTTDWSFYDHQEQAVFWAGQASEEIRTWAQWTGHMVFDYPGAISFNIVGGNADVSMSGYSLRLP